MKGKVRLWSKKSALERIRRLWLEACELVVSSYEVEEETVTRYLSVSERKEYYYLKELIA